MRWGIFGNGSNVGTCRRYLRTIRLESVRFTGYAAKFSIWWNGKPLLDHDHTNFIGTALEITYFGLQFAIGCRRCVFGVDFFFFNQIFYTKSLFCCCSESLSRFLEPFQINRYHNHFRLVINLSQQLWRTKFRIVGLAIWWRMPTTNISGWMKVLLCFWKEKLRAECLAKRLVTSMHCKV